VQSGSVTVHACVAGLSSVFPAASVARTRSSCAPSPRPVYSFGEAHDTNAAPSSEHSNVAPASLAARVRLAEVLVVLAAGPDGIVVCGAVESTVQLQVAGVASIEPDESTARTRSSCAPSARPS
jgi:hypothetical protein